MKIQEFVEIIKKKNIISILNHALSLTNEKREFDSSGSTLAYDLRDKIKRIGNMRGIEISFENNKLTFSIGNTKCEIKSYNNRKKVKYTNNQFVPIQGCLFADENKDFIDIYSPIVIGHITNKPRKKFHDIFVEYKSQNGLRYSVDMLSENISDNISTNSTDTVPSFFKPKKGTIRKNENE